MRNLIAIFLIIMTLGMLLSGCRTTEANYRAAYQTAVARRDSSGGVDSTIYARIRRDATMSVLVAGGDSLPLRTEHIAFTPDGGASREGVHRYCIVAGQFKQLFNAKQMRRRLAEAGYEGAFVVNTREPLYYVCTASYASPDSAAVAFRRLSSDPSQRLLPPAPFILRPAHLAR